MATAMLNVRLDKSLKLDGEKVLAKEGVSATEAVRNLYMFMQQNREVPDFCKSKGSAPAAEARRRKMRQLVGFAKMNPSEDSASVKSERLARLEF